MSFFVLVVFFCPRRSIYMYYVLISAYVSLAITWCSTCKNLACVMWRSGFFSHLKINRTFDAPRNVASMFSKILFWRSDNLTLDELCRPKGRLICSRLSSERGILCYGNFAITKCPRLQRIRSYFGHILRASSIFRHLKMMTMSSYLCFV